MQDYRLQVSKCKKKNKSQTTILVLGSWRINLKLNHKLNNVRFHFVGEAQVSHAASWRLHFFCFLGSFWSVWRRLSLGHLAGLHGAHNVLQCPLLFTQGVLLQGELALLGSDEFFDVGARWQGWSRGASVISRAESHWAFSTFSIVTWAMTAGVGNLFDPFENVFQREPRHILRLKQWIRTANSSVRSSSNFFFF